MIRVPIEIQLAASILAIISVGLPGLAVPPSGPPQGNPPAPSAATTTNASGPKIIFETPVYDFGKLSSGETMKHTFVFTNAGNEKLVITSVQPSCGCTTAGEWTHEVEPGKAGTIPIQFNSGSFNGPVSKSVSVVSNDKSQPTAHLQIKGTIWKPIEVAPPYAVLNVLPDSGGGTTTVTITNNLETAVHLWGAQSSNPAFSATLKTNEPGKWFQVVVGTVPPLRPGSVQGSVSLKSTLTNSPITFTVWANVQPAITVVPPTLNLPQAPLANKLTPIITIINNTTNPLALSNPSVDVPGVDVQVKEVQPGRYFTAVVSFPEGFIAPEGKPLEFSVHSSNPKFETIKVPIVQAPKPAAGVPTATPGSASPPTQSSLAISNRVALARQRRTVPPFAPPVPSAKLATQGTAPE